MSAVVPELDVVIVGAGPAGLGTGVVLQDLGLDAFAILERYEPGASFARWPAEMRLITPSFTANGHGLLDLNAIALGVSPAYSLWSEHPTGAAYARWLAGFAERFDLPVRTGVDVWSVEPIADGFRLHTNQGEVTSRFVIWAAGEFQYPRLDTFPGADLCAHSASVGSWSTWSEATEGPVVVLGGAESGIDAAMHLINQGKEVLVLDAGRFWDRESSDPSLALSPFTRERLAAAMQTGLLTLVGDARIEQVDREDGDWIVRSEDGRVWTTSTVPVLATGFTGSISLLGDLFAHDETGKPIFSIVDESTRTPGLFAVGPAVHQESFSFCFIYKFRQRFAVVAQEIGERLGLDLAPLDDYRAANLFLDDFTCCGESCRC